MAILAQGGNKKAEDELFRRIRSSLIASAERFEHLYSGLNLETDDLKLLPAEKLFQFIKNKGHFLSS